MTTDPRTLNGVRFVVLAAFLASACSDEDTANGSSLDAGIEHTTTGGRSSTGGSAGAGGRAAGSGGSTPTGGRAAGNGGASGSTGGGSPSTGGRSQSDAAPPPDGSTTADARPPPITDGSLLKSYSTNFDGDENPISENGAWSQSGLDWTKVAKSGGIAYGTQTGRDGYDDSFAILSGFTADHTASGVIHLINNIDASCTHEVEILLRWADDAHNARGYECNVNFDGGYVQIVRWNGPLGDFTVLGGGNAPGLKDGDTLKATIVGSDIRVFVNDVERAQVTDGTFTTGNPGMGFFRRDCGAGSDFGFTSFSATSLGP